MPLSPLTVCRVRFVSILTPVQGHLNQSEFGGRVDHFVTIDPRIEHLHNNFICAIIGNLTRDLPDHGVASWVSANDKPTVVSKPISGDAAEQRLKTEVMQLPPRDRRRLKAIPEVGVMFLSIKQQPILLDHSGLTSISPLHTARPSIGTQPL